MSVFKSDGFPPHLQLQLTDSEIRKQIRALPALSNRLPDPMSTPSVPDIRLNGVNDKASRWVLTEDMAVEAKTFEAKTKQRAEKVKKIVEEATARDEGKEIKPSNKGARKLTEDDVRTIRKRAEQGVSNRLQAEDFNVTQAAIWNIVRRNTWKHVK